MCEGEIEIEEVCVRERANKIRTEGGVGDEKEGLEGHQ